MIQTTSFYNFREKYHRAREKFYSAKLVSTFVMSYIALNMDGIKVCWSRKSKGTKEAEIGETEVCSN